MFGWLRRRRPPPEIPEAMWRGVLARYPFLGEQPPDHRERLRHLAARFLQDKEFTGANGLVVTDEMALSIAAQAVLPVLWLGLDWYDDFVGIVVHPGEVLARRTVVDDAGVVHQYHEQLAGEAMDRGPIMLSWSDVQAAGGAAQAGYNLVIHEFAHKLDLRDGVADGRPPLRSAAQGEQWRAAFSAAFDQFREQVIMAERFGAQAPWLDAYAATDPGEFFAVACEAYFVNRERFGAEFPTLLPLLDSFFLAERPY